MEITTMYYLFLFLLFFSRSLMAFILSVFPKASLPGVAKMAAARSERDTESFFFFFSEGIL